MPNRMVYGTSGAQHHARYHEFAPPRGFGYLGLDHAKIPGPKPWKLRGLLHLRDSNISDLATIPGPKPLKYRHLGHCQRFKHKQKPYNLRG